jgi:heme a synthase
VNVPPTFEPGRWLVRYAALTAAATLGLVCLGGLVTSKGVGMSVPDWPTSYGYNMFALPFSTWFTGGVFQEHTHRLWASWVGILVVGLTRWLGGRSARLPLAVIGALEVAAGLLLRELGPDWKGAAYFLSGIGGVVLLASVIWARHQPAARPLPALGWLAFTLVQVQGLLGGLRVVLDKQVVADTTLGTVFGLLHACLGQGFFVLLCIIFFLLTRPWRRLLDAAQSVRLGSLAWLVPLTTSVIFLQLVLGGMMRHQHAGLAIHDFPLAYGALWPATDPEALARYNQVRPDEAPVTAFQIHLQLFHRLGAAIALTLVAVGFAVSRRGAAPAVIRRGIDVWVSLLLAQFFLGAATLWTDKAADVATTHVAFGALSLANGALLTLVVRRLARPVARNLPNERASVPVFAKTSVR